MQLVHRLDVPEICLSISESIPLDYREFSAGNYREIHVRFPTNIPCLIPSKRMVNYDKQF